MCVRVRERERERKEKKREEREGGKGKRERVDRFQIFVMLCSMLFEVICICGSDQRRFQWYRDGGALRERDACPATMR